MKPVNESRIAQINGKMLIASKRSIVGRMNSQAIERSDRPRSASGDRRGRSHGHAVDQRRSDVRSAHVVRSWVIGSLPGRRAAAEGEIGLSPDEGRNALPITTDPCLPA